MPKSHFSLHIVRTLQLHSRMQLQRLQMVCHFSGSITTLYYLTSNPGATATAATSPASCEPDTSQLLTSSEPSTVDNMININEDNEDDSATNSATQSSKKPVRKRKQVESKFQFTFLVIYAMHLTNS